MLTMRRSPSGPFQPVGLPSILQGDPGDQDAVIEGARSALAVYVADVSALTAPRIYTPADAPGNSDGDQIQVYARGVAAQSLTVGGVVIPAGSGTEQNVLLERIGGVWAPVGGSVNEAAAPPAPAGTPTFAGAVAATSLGIPLLVRGFAEFESTADNQPLLFGTGLRIQSSGDVSAFQVRFQVFASGGGGASLQTLDDTSFGDLHQAETWNWTEQRFGVLALPAGLYRLNLAISATGGSPSIVGSAGGVWATLL